MIHIKLLKENTVRTRYARLIFLAIISGSILFLVALLLHSSEPAPEATFAASPVEMIVYPAAQAVEKGQDLRVDIWIDPLNNPISAVQFDLGFNGTLLHIKNVTEGDLLKQNGAKTIFNSNPLNNKGTEVIRAWGVIITPGANVTTKGTLARITFLASYTGSSPLELSNVVVGEPSGQEVRVNITNGGVNITGSVPG